MQKVKWFKGYMSGEKVTFLCIMAISMLFIFTQSILVIMWTQNQFGSASFLLAFEVWLPWIKHEVSEETVLRIRKNSHISAIHRYGQYTKFQSDDIRKLE